MSFVSLWEKIQATPTENYKLLRRHFLEEIKFQRIEKAFYVNEPLEKFYLTMAIYEIIFYY